MKTTKPLLLFVITITLCGTVLAQDQFSEGLVAYYPFNGNAKDVSGNGNDGTVAAAVLTKDRFGIPNSAYAFDGVSSLIAVPDSTSLRISNDITVTCWVLLSTNLNKVRFVGKGGDCGRDYGLWLDQGTNWMFQQFPPGGGCGGCQENTASSVPPVENAKWFQIIGVREGSISRLYVNGVLVQDRSPTCAAFTYAGGEPLIIGAFDNPVTDPRFDVMQGSLDDIRIYNKALSSNQIARLYAIESVPPLPYLNVALTLTIYTQTTGQNNGVVTTAPIPKPVRLSTKDFLNVLAIDEHLQGNWPSNSFPKTAKLAVAGRTFIIADGTNALLNVSDIMSFSFGEKEIVSGSQNNATGLANPGIQRRQIVKIAFDDTFIAGASDSKFYLQGFFTESISDTTPVGGSYTEVHTAKLANAAGEGSSQNVPFVCTGTATATGKGALAF